MTVQFVDPRTRWDAEAVDDLRLSTPRERLEAWARWSRRAAQAKGEVALRERAVSHLQGRARDAHVAALAIMDEAFASRVRANAPAAELEDAEAALSTAIEAEDFASRVCRAIERPRNTGQVSAKPQFGVQNGGRK